MLNYKTDIISKIQIAGNYRTKTLVCVCVFPEKEKSAWKKRGTEGFYRLKHINQLQCVYGLIWTLNFPQTQKMWQLEIVGSDWVFDTIN